MEIIRRGFERFLATGEPSWEALADDFELQDHDSPDQDVYSGHAGYGQWLEDWDAAWEKWTLQLERLVDAGDSVVAIYRLRVKGKGSGVELDHSEAQVWRLRGGKAVRLDVYSSAAEALEAVGLCGVGDVPGNVELVRKGYDSWLARRSLDFDLLDAEIEWRTADLLDGGVVLHGHEGVRKWFRQMDQIWEDMWWDVERLDDVGDQVLAISGLTPEGATAARPRSWSSARSGPSARARRSESDLYGPF